MASLILRTPEETRRLAAALAELLCASTVRAVLLYGPLGSGKTLFTSGLVRALPGGAQAEVASPSFSLCNRYPTRPPVLHGDLYRCAGDPEEVPEELLVGLETPELLVVLEWAEYLPREEMPQEYLDIRLQPCDKGRLLTLHSHGPCAGEVSGHLFDNAAWTQF